MVKNILIALLATVVMFGCKSDKPKDVGTQTNVKAVVVGVEKSSVFGRCPGARVDSNRMNNLLKKNVKDITLLQDENATKDNFKAAMELALDSDLMIVYYSGHGGSQRFSDTGPEEEDGKDEFLCLYDGPFRDNDIWGYIQRAKGRVFLVFDCCHSETMFRTVGFTMAMTDGMVFPADSNTIKMLCWSGCADSTFSYGSATGGEFTNALLKYYKNGITYDDLWDAISKDKHLKYFEEVKRTQIGSGFSGEVFK